MSDHKSKQEVFKLGYDEVLSALKHQDEKLNRTLTALAFLTAAGVTLYLQSEPRAQVRFSEGGPSIPAVMFIIFLAAVTIALLTALAAIGPGAALRLRAGSEPREASLIYYAAIAADDRWTERVGKSEKELNDLLLRNLHEETRMIASRVTYKVARSRESGAFVQLAILALTLLGIFQAGQPEGTAGDGLGDPARWWVAAALIFTVLALPFWERWQMERYGYATGPWGEAYPVLVLPVLISAVLLSVAQAIDQHWAALGYALIVLLATRLAILSRKAAQVLLPATGVLGVVLLPCLFLL